MHLPVRILNNKLLDEFYHVVGGERGLCRSSSENKFVTCLESPIYLISPLHQVHHDDHGMRNTNNANVSVCGRKL